MKTSYMVKGKVTTRKGAFHWSVEDANGNRMAYGTEYHLRHAFQAVYDTVSAVRAWTMYGRGDLLCQDSTLTFDFRQQRRA
jgi:hypothetical protein